MAPMEFKARKDKHGKLTIMPNIEKKADGSIIVHAPSLQLIQEFNKKHGI